MNEQKVLRQFMPRLRSVSADICLILPAGPLSLQRQVDQIQEAIAQLEQIKRQVNWVFRGQRFEPVNPTYLFLCSGIDAMLLVASTLEVLAAEFPADATGTLSCLRSVDREWRSVQLQLQASELRPIELQTELPTRRSAA